MQPLVMTTAQCPHDVFWSTAVFFIVMLDRIRISLIRNSKDSFISQIGVSRVQAWKQMQRTETHKNTHLLLAVNNMNEYAYWLWKYQLWNSMQNHSPPPINLECIKPFFFKPNSILHISNLHRSLCIRYVYKIEWNKQSERVFSSMTK